MKPPNKAGRSVFNKHVAATAVSGNLMLVHAGGLLNNGWPVILMPGSRPTAKFALLGQQHCRWVFARP